MTNAAVLASEIRSAFKGVRLGTGISARQTEVIDQFGKGYTPSQFATLPLGEVTDDWTRIPVTELERVQVAHLDAMGLRYYLPALMLSLMENYDPMSLRVIGTFLALYPKSKDWDYHMERYRELSDLQKSAIAVFLEGLPSVVSLDEDGQKMVVRALQNYWGQFRHRD